MSQFLRWLRSHVRRLFRSPPCLCRSRAEDFEFYRERDALVAEWCQLLPLADVLDLTTSDAADPISFPDISTMVMTRYPDVVVPRELVRRTFAWSANAALFLIEPLFFGPTGRKLTIDDFLAFRP